MVKIILATIISSLIGGFISGYICLYEFRTNHSVMTVYEKDALFVRDELQNYINNNLFMEENKNVKSSNKRE